MKIKVDGDKIVKGVKKLEGIEIVIQDHEDAREGIDLILNKTEMGADLAEKLTDIKTTASQSYETSAVDYKMVFLLEFVFQNHISLDERVAIIRTFQEFMEKV